MVSSMELRDHCDGTYAIIQWQGNAPKALMKITKRQAKTLARLLREKGF